MKPILILYATREGQTERIAAHIAAAVRARGLEAQVVDVAKEAPALELRDYSIIILAASVHMGKHEAEMVRFVKQHREALASVPTAFLSTSMTEAAATRGDHSAEERSEAHAEAERRLQEFFATTGFYAPAHRTIAGALLYTQYNWLLRMVMKHISKTEGVSTDTSHDHEYTDWLELDRFVSGLLSGELFKVAATNPPVEPPIRG
jgi:menaquinone-dependent protoporphyrinogen oxidase